MATPGSFGHLYALLDVVAVLWRRGRPRTDRSGVDGDGKRRRTLARLGIYLRSLVPAAQSKCWDRPSKGGDVVAQGWMGTPGEMLLLVGTNLIEQSADRYVLPS
jgi:hypothetical protein